MRTPYELMAFSILPRARALVAKELLEMGHSQVAVAKLLGVTQPAVSQYLTQNRARRVALLETPAARKRIKQLAKSIAEGKDANKELCLFCEELKSPKSIKSLCSHHREIAEVPENCGLCEVVS